MAKKRGGNRWVALKNKAKREGWLEWVKNPSDEKAMYNGCVFSKRRADHIVEFFPTFLCHFKGRLAGKPFYLETWQENEIIRPIFGWVREDQHGDTVRRFTRAYIEIPKKNGKSTLLGGVGAYMLGADGEMGALVCSVAVDRGQAKIVHETGVNLVMSSPRLMREYKVHQSTHRITHGATRSRWQALAGAGWRNEGLDASCFLADELHAWKGRKLFDAIRYGMAARSQPLFFMITTAGDDKESVCYEMHEYGRSVESGEWDDDRFYNYIRAAGPDDDIWDDAVGMKANPGWGTTINVEEFKQDRNEAKQSIESTNSFKRYRLNLWVSGTNPAISEDDWRGCASEDITREKLAGRDCVAALDMSRTEDSTSIQLAFDLGDGRGCFLSFYFYPKEMAEKMNDRVPWLKWESNPNCNTVLIPGRTIKDSYIKEALAELAEEFEIVKFTYDPLFVDSIADYVEDELEIECVPFPQSMKSYAEPSSVWEQMIIDREIVHLNNPVMNWNVRNLEWYTDNNRNKRPVKRKPKDYRKVDGAVASIMANGVLFCGDDESGSAYDDPDGGVIFI